LKDVTSFTALIITGAPKKCNGRSYPESAVAVASVIAAKRQPIRNRYIPTGCGVFGNGLRQQHVLFSNELKHDVNEGIDADVVM
jgi:hypothetical protein